MAVTGKWFGLCFTAMLNKEIDWLTDTIKCSLHTSTYSPSQDTDDYFNDATNEITGTGYTAGGVTLAGKTIGYTAATNVTKLDSTDPEWTSSTLTWRTAVVRDTQTGVATTEPLMIYQTDTVDYSTTNGTATIQWNASGMATITPD